MIADRVLSKLEPSRPGNYPWRAEDLTYAMRDGIAWQTDLMSTCPYDDAYFEKCLKNDESLIASELNAGRIAMVARHIGGNRVCDVGIGGGAFVRARPNTWGYDINPKAAAWLAMQGLLGMRLEDFAGLTFWDTLEHLPQPEVYLDRVQLNQYVFCSLPVFQDLAHIKKSKHYRPGEHLLYFTEFGFLFYMMRQGFLFLEVNDFESRAGREGIKSFAFRRCCNPRDVL